MKKLISYILILFIEVTLVMNNYMSSVNAVESIINGAVKNETVNYDIFDQVMDHKMLMSELKDGLAAMREAERIAAAQKEVNNQPKSAGYVQTYSKPVQNLSSETVIDKSLFEVSVPSGLRTVKTDDYTILIWDSVKNAERYELEFDGQIIDCGDKTLFVQKNLNDSDIHKYRVRAVNSLVTGEWSSFIEVDFDNGVFDAPMNVAALPTGNSIIVCWSSMNSGDGYEIEVDGKVIDNGTSTNYVHRDLQPGSEHTYKIRTKQGKLYSKWSKAVKATAVKKMTVDTPVIKEENIQKLPEVTVKEEDIEKASNEEKESKAEETAVKEELDVEKEESSKLETIKEEKASVSNEVPVKEEKAPVKEKTEKVSNSVEIIKNDVITKDAAVVDVIADEEFNEEEAISLAYLELDRVAEENSRLNLEAVLTSLSIDTRAASADDAYVVKAFSSLNTSSSEIVLDAIYEIAQNQTFTITSDKVFKINTNKRYVGFKVNGTLILQGSASKYFNLTLTKNHAPFFQVGKGGSLAISYFNGNGNYYSGSPFISNEGTLKLNNSNFKYIYNNDDEIMKPDFLLSDSAKDVTISDCTIDSWKNGITLRGTGSGVIQKNNILNNVSGITFDGQDDYSLSNKEIKIINNPHIDFNKVGISIYRKGDEPLHKKISIGTNSFDGNKMAGILFETDKIYNVNVNRNIFTKTNANNTEYGMGSYSVNERVDIYGGPICINLSDINETNDRLLSDGISNINSGFNVIKAGNNVSGIVLYGKLKNNLTLKAGAYKYVFVDTVINEGSTLTLNSGVQAAIHGHLVLNGALIGLGTSASNAYISSVDDTTNPLPYSKSELKNTGFSIIVNKTGIIDAVYTQFLGGATSYNNKNYAGIENYNSVTLRRGCVVTAKSKSLVAVKNNSTGKLTLTEVEIKNSGDGVFNDRGEVTLLKCNIHDNAVTGVKSSNGKALMSKCNFTNNTNEAVRFTGVIELYNSTISGSKIGVAAVSSEKSDKTSKIMCNNIKNNTEGIRIHYYTFLIIEGNNITGNTSYGVNYKANSGAAGSGTININNNYWGHANGPRHEKRLTDINGNTITQTISGGDYIGLVDGRLVLTKVSSSTITTQVSVDEDKLCNDSYQQLKDYADELEKKKFENSGSQANGNYSTSSSDLVCSTAGINIDILRMYNSQGNTGAYQGVFGKGWRFYYVSYVMELQDEMATTAEGKVFYLPGGESCLYQKNSDGSYTALNTRNTLTVEKNGHFTITDKNGMRYRFDGRSLYEMEDKKGNKLYFQNDQDFVSKIWDDTGREFRLEYSGRYLTSIKEVIGGKVLRTLTYKYIDAPKFNDKLLESVTDTNGNVIEKYVYNAEGMLYRILRDSDVVEEITYYTDGTNKGKIKTVKNRDGLISTYTYNNYLNSVTIKDNTNYRYDIFYNSKFNTTYNIDSNGSTTINKYEANGYLYDKDKKIIGTIQELTEMVDKYGFKKVYKKDNKGNIIGEYYAKTDAAITYEYDKYNNVISMKDQKGNKTYYIYDSQGKNILKIVKPLNGTDVYKDGVDESKFEITKFEYYDKVKDKMSFHGLVKQITKPGGSRVKYMYDKFGNRTYEIVEAYSGIYYVIKYTYDEFGNKISQSNPYKITDPNGDLTMPQDTGVFKYTYDKKGNKLSETNQIGATTKFLYDKYGRKIGVINPNDVGRKDANGKDVISMTYTYNAAGRLSSEKDMYGNVKEYSYDVSGNLTKEKNSLGGIFLYTYDSYGRVIKTEFKENESAKAIILEENRYFSEICDMIDYSFLIAQVVNIKKTYYGDGKFYVTADTYDYKNNLKKHINLKPEAYNLEFPHLEEDMIISFNENIYDGKGNITAKLDENGQKTYFYYDINDRMVKHYEPISKGKYRVTEIIYDKDGNKIRERVGGELVNLGEGIKDYVVNNTFTNSNNTQISFGNKKSFFEKVFTYNKAGQLLLETDNSGRKTAYEYNIRGNLINKKEYFTDTKYLYSGYEYDNAGRLINEYITVDSKDLITYGQNSLSITKLYTRYTYDKNDNLIKTVYRDGSTLVNTYDALNRLVKTVKTIIDHEGETREVQETFKYAANTDKVIESINGLGNKIVHKYDSKLLLIETNYYSKNNGSYVLLNTEKYGYNYLDEEISKTVFENNTERTFIKEYDFNGNVILEQFAVKNADNTKKYYAIKAYKYDLSGNLIKEINGQQYNDAKGSSVEEKINNAKGTEKTYDYADRLISILSPEDKALNKKLTISYEYDAYGNKISETDSYGNSFRYYYDQAGRVVGKVFDGKTADGIVEKYTYDKMGNLLSSTDANGNTIRYEINSFGAVKEEILPSDESIGEERYSYLYDVFGNLAVTETSTGKIIKVIRDSENNEVYKFTGDKYGKNTEEFYSYDAAGNLVSFVDANGRKITYKYDMYGNVIEKSINGKVIYKYSYDFFNNLLCTTDRFGNKVINVYDECGKLIEKKYCYKEIKDGKEQDVYLIIEENQYDLNCNLISKKDALGNTITYKYDLNNRLIETVDQVGVITKKEYDSNDNLIKEIDGRGTETIYEYSGSGRLLSVTKGSIKSSYVYDNNGNKIISSVGDNKTYYKYNCRDEVVSMWDNDAIADNSKCQTYTYNVDGSIKNVKDKNGNVISYEYDIFGRKIKETCSDKIITYTYDSVGNLTHVTDSSSEQKETIFTYDSENRVTYKSVTFASGSSVKTSYTYDKKVEGTGKHQITIEINNYYSVTETYDEMGRLVQVNDTAYTYYDNGSKKETIFANGSKELYFYNKDLTLSSLKHVSASGELQSSFNYKYDANKNLLETTDSKGITRYTYDELNRLIKVITPDNKITQYEYDSAGNRIREIVTIGQDSYDKVYIYKDGRLVKTIDNLTGVNLETDFTYDYNGNTLNEVTKTMDANASVIKDRKFVYDNYNRVISIIEGDKVLETNSYNYEGLRVVKDVNGKKTINVYDDTNVLVELNELFEVKAKNIFGTKLISREVNKVKGYYRHNGHGDVVFVRDENDSLLVSYYYDAFGKIESKEGNFDNPYRYCGYIYDEEAEYYYLQARMYDPVNGRFISEDSYKGEANDPLSLNLYAYCANNPLMYDDQNGHFFSKIKNAVSNAVSSAKRAVSSAVNKVKSAYNTVKTAVTNVVKKTVNFVKNIPTAIKNAYNNYVKPVVNKVVNTVKNTYNATVNWVKKQQQEAAERQRQIQEARRIEQEKKAQKHIQQQQEKYNNSIQKVDNLNFGEFVSGVQDLGLAGGAILTGLTLSGPIGWVALGVGVGYAAVSSGEILHSFTGVDPVRDLAKSCGMSDTGYDIMSEVLAFGCETVSQYNPKKVMPKGLNIISSDKGASKAVKNVSSKGKVSKNAGQGVSRKQALAEIKRDLGISKHQHPIDQKMVDFRDTNNKRILDSNNNFVKSRELIYSVKGKVDGAGRPIDTVVIQDHSYGHYYKNGIGDQPSHFNVRPGNNTDTGSVKGMKDHYYFDFKKKR